MMAAILVLLVGLGALAVGVLLGRYYVPDDRMVKRQARHGRAYLRALTHLIARDNDTVIDELRKVVDDNVDDSEPYFALAALFRARGESERAIRVHQALAVRESATSRLRQRALYELGLDFRAAGMPRRAVKALEQVVAGEPGHEGSLRALCGLYEEQGRFAEAASAWTRLAKLRDESPPRRHHHLLCAAAQQAIADGELDSAKQLLRDARTVVESPHFFAAAAELAAARSNPKAAKERLRQALTAAPELAAYLVPGLAAAETQLLGEAAGATPTATELDEDVAEATGSVALALPAPAPVPMLELVSLPAAVVEPVSLAVRASTALARTLAELADSSGSPHLALAAAGAATTLDPAVGRVRLERIAVDAPGYLPGRLGAARLALATDDAVAHQRELAALVGALAWADGAAWRCRHCGQRSERFAWRCGSCRRWATAAPEIGRERAEAPREAPRERRAERRTSLALLGERADQSLPSGAIEHGLSEDELLTRAQRRSMLGKMGGWISGAWSGVRRKNRS